MTHDSSLFNQAGAAYQKGLFSQALALCEQQLGANPTDIDALNLAGFTLLEMCAPAKALTYFEKALVLYPQQPELLRGAASALLMLGSFNQAAQYAQQAAALYPDNPDVLFCLLNAFIAQESFASAVEVGQRILNSSPNDIAILSTQAALLQKLARWSDAIAIYKHILEMAPNNLVALNGIVHCLSKKNDYAAALNFCQRAVRLVETADHYNNLGVCLQKLNHFSEAVKCYEKAITLDSTYQEAYYNWGKLLQEKQDFQKAAALYRTAILHPPLHSPILRELGKCLFELKDFVGAQAVYQKLVSLNLEDSEAHNNLGCCYQRLNCFNEAKFHYRQAISYANGFTSAYCNLGGILEWEMDLEQAETYYKTHVALFGDSAEVYFKLGLIQAKNNHHLNAVELYDRALLLEPNHSYAKFSKSISLLFLERFTEGFNLYESRWETDHTIRHFPIFLPKWDGGELNNKRLLILWEQGIGDGLQMCRYLHELDAQQISYSAQAPIFLEGLFKRSFKGKIISAEFPNETSTIGYDVCITYMDFPRLMKLSCLADIPQSTPYLSPDPKKIAFWNTQLKTNQKPMIILTWSGNRSTALNALKSTPVSCWTPLFKRSDIEIICLEKDISASERVFLEAFPNVRILSDALIDFDDTAAIMSLASMVISTDTAAAHLAGALGLPLWVVLPFFSDWRWFLDRSDSPWYPTARLFRQPQHGDWQMVVSEINVALNNMLPA